MKTLDEIIAYLETTVEESWCLDVVKKGDKNCLFGHLFELGGSDLYHMFEEFYATTYMVFPVNDGTHEDYRQETPKQRCIAYLKDLRDGKQKTTSKLHEEFEQGLL